MVGAESGPVSVALSKRMRAIKKKLNKAEQIEQAVAAGKEINEDQTEVMKSKPSWVAVIDELGKLEGLLKDAVDEEIKIARQAWEEEAAAGRGKDTEAEERAAEQEQPQQPPAAAEESAQAGGKDSLQECLQEIIPLIYFSRVRARVPTPPAAPNRAPSLPSPSIPAALANWPARARCYPLPPPQMGDPAAHALSPRRPKQMFEKTAKDLLSIDPIEREMCIRQLTQNENVKEAERYACQSWVNQACADKLKEQDMDLIVQFGKLLTCRPAGQIISHEAAIEQCCSLAKKYLLQKSESLAEMAAPGQSAPTGSYLSEQLSKIMSSEYFTVKPVNSSINLVRGAEALPSPRCGRLLLRVPLRSSRPLFALGGAPLIPHPLLFFPPGKPSTQQRPCAPLALFSTSPPFPFLSDLQAHCGFSKKGPCRAF